MSRARAVPDDVTVRKPEEFHAIGMLHAARGIPVVWFVFSTDKLPPPGRWKLLDASGRVIARVTVDCERVFV